MHLRYRKTCRACGSSALTKVIDLGSQYIQGAFIKPGEPEPAHRRIPLELVRCDPALVENGCGLLQTSCSVPPEILYSRYWYRSGTNRTMREHLRSIAEEATSLSGAGPRRVLDIGCNDGTLLGYYPANFRKVGVDSSNAVEGITGDITVIQDTFPSDDLSVTLSEGLFDVVTSIAMFYDLEDPIAFTRSVADVLAPTGLWIFEMSYMPTMLRMNAYDTICHEHLEYYSLAVIEHILRTADLKLVRVSLNEINGGSIRCYATHRTNFSYRNAEELRQALDALRRDEFDLELDTDQPYRDFQNRILQHREDLTRMVRELKRAGKRIHVYGASTKGNTILQFCGLDSAVIDYAADRNPDKFGARTIGSDIPIISEEESRALEPDYYLVLPWHFRAEFLERERATLERGTKMIFPLPKLEVIGR